MPNSPNSFLFGLDGQCTSSSTRANILALYFVIYFDHPISLKLKFTLTASKNKQELVSRLDWTTASVL